MAYQVPPLPYDYGALEPTIDEATMRLHHDKHHQAYVDKANLAVEGTDLEGKPVEEVLASLDQLPDDRRSQFRDNGGGHTNHTLFWESMSPDGGGRPTGELADAINSSFGSFEDFRTQFEANGVAQFGSGWTWLVLEGDSLRLSRTPNQDSPILDGQTPLLGNDVWEHAYYLTYNNRRPDYLKAWWDVVSWNSIAERYAEAVAQRQAAVR